MQFSRRSGLIFLGLLALLFNGLFFLLFLCDNPCALMYDSAHYHAAARNIVDFHAYLGDGGAPLFYRLPGYPLLLAFFYSIAGKSVHMALALQLVCASMIPVLTFFLVEKLTLNRVLACWTGVLAAMTPGGMIFAGLVMSEVMFLTFFLLFLLAFLKAFESCSRLTFIVSGLLLGVCSLIRPLGHLLIIPLGLFLLIFLRGAFVRRVGAVIVFCSGWLCVVGIWLVRNFAFTGSLFFHTLPGPHFVNHVAVRLIASSQGISYEAAKTHAYAEIHARSEALMQKKGRNLLEIERCQLAEKFTVDVVLDNIVPFLKLAFFGCIKTACGLYSSELLVIDAHGALPSYEETSLWQTLKKYLLPDVHNKKIWFVIYYEIVLLVLSFLGFLLAAWKFWKKFLDPNVLLVLGLCVFFISSSFACGYARLRFACEPFYLLAAAYACYVVSGRSKSDEP